MSTAKIATFMQRLADRKEQLEREFTPKDKLKAAVKAKWEPKQQEKVVNFTKKLAEVQQVVKLEIAILESIQDFVGPEVFKQIETTLVKVRKSNDLLQMNSVFHRHRNDVKIRQVVKLVNAVYRYNRDVITGIEPYPVVKSNIKHATLCPHCGEISGKILQRMRESKAVMLPS